MGGGTESEGGRPVASQNPEPRPESVRRCPEAFSMKIFLRALYKKNYCSIVFLTKLGSYYNTKLDIHRAYKYSESKANIGQPIPELG
jgi:hypothetical protein